MTLIVTFFTFVTYLIVNETIIVKNLNKKEMKRLLDILLVNVAVADLEWADDMEAMRCRVDYPGL